MSTLASQYEQERRDYLTIESMLSVIGKDTPYRTGNSVSTTHHAKVSKTPMEAMDYFYELISGLMSKVTKSASLDSLNELTVDTKKNYILGCVDISQEARLERIESLKKQLTTQEVNEVEKKLSNLKNKLEIGNRIFEQSVSHLRG